MADKTVPQTTARPILNPSANVGLESPKPTEAPTPKAGAPAAPINSTGPASTNSTKRTLSDVIEHHRAIEAGQPSPHDIPDHVVEAAKRSGAIPIGQGAAGQVLRTDQVADPRPTLGPFRPLSPDEALAEYGPDSTEMIFTSPVSFTTDDRKQIDYTAGTHKVPSKLASHPFFEANGAKAKAEPETRHLPPIQEGKEKTAPPRK
jgi:hypothetical protein